MTAGSLVVSHSAWEGGPSCWYRAPGSHAEEQHVGRASPGNSGVDKSPVQCESKKTGN